MGDPLDMQRQVCHVICFIYVPFGEWEKISRLQVVLIDFNRSVSRHSA